jgi:SAM-dependent methyltransferase
MKIHPEDYEYFKRYSKDAKSEGLSLDDYYLKIQPDTYKIIEERKIKMDQEVSILFASEYLDKDDSILLMGCGEGLEIKWLVERGYKNITGIDISDQSIEDCKRIYGINVVKNDMRKTDFLDLSFDYVITRRSLHHLFYPFKVLEEFSRLAKKGVILIGEPTRRVLKKRIKKQRIISFANIYEYEFPIEDVVRYMLFNGFKLKNVKYTIEDINIPFTWAKILSRFKPLTNRFTAVFNRIET